VQDVAGHQPVEQMAQGRELLLDALGLIGLALELHPGRDMDGFDVAEVRDPGLDFRPAQEVPHGPQVRLARVAVSDLRGEELQESLFGPGAHDQGRHRGYAAHGFQNS
jgi:hypothetical protein